VSATRRLTRRDTTTRKKFFSQKRKLIQKRARVAALVLDILRSHTVMAFSHGGKKQKKNTTQWTEHQRFRIIP
jgi:hypothetical protein